MVEQDVYGADLWMCFRECVWMALGVWMAWVLGQVLNLLWYQIWCIRQGSKLKLMYLSRVQAKNQVKSESLEPSENTIKENSRKLCWLWWICQGKDEANLKPTNYMTWISETRRPWGGTVVSMDMAWPCQNSTKYDWLWQDS